MQKQNSAADLIHFRLSKIMGIQDKARDLLKEAAGCTSGDVLVKLAEAIAALDVDVACCQSEIDAIVASDRFFGWDYGDSEGLARKESDKSV